MKLQKDRLQYWQLRGLVSTVWDLTCMCDQNKQEFERKKGNVICF